MCLKFRQLLSIHASNEPSDLCNVPTSIPEYWKTSSKILFTTLQKIICLSPKKWAKHGCTCNILFQWKGYSLAQKEYSHFHNWSTIGQAFWVIEVGYHRLSDGGNMFLNSGNKIPSFKICRISNTDASHGLLSHLSSWYIFQQI